MVEDYSTNPTTIASRKCYHNKTKRQKKVIFNRQERLKKKKVAEGKCSKCGKPRERQEITTCNSCHQKMLNRVKEYSINNALEGKCCKCPNPADGTSSHCKQCKEKARLAMWAKRHATTNATT